MKYKMVAIDLDGTLLNSNNQLSLHNRETIKKASEKGVEILLISGRPYISMKSIADELELKECFIVALAGCDIRKYPSNESIFHSEISKDQILNLSRIADELGCYMQIFNLNGEYFFRNQTVFSKMYEEYFGYSGKECNLTDVYNVCKAMYIMEEENMPIVEKVLEKKLPQGLRAEKIWKNMIDIYNAEIDKGKALEYVVQNLGLNMEDVIAFGDEKVDFSMIKKAGLGVAMANAIEEIKECANEITLSNDEDGVAHIIEKYIL